MKYVFSLAVLMAAPVVVGPATAADLMVSEPGVVEAAHNPFDGFYIGVHAGYGMSTTTGDACFEVFLQLSCDEVTAIDYDQRGYLLGAQAGANLVTDNGLLLGGEVSGSWANIFGAVDDEGPAGYQRTVDAIGLAVGKLGFATDTFALYGMGGLALGHSITDIDMIVAELGYETMHTGWTLGLGAEAMVSDNVSVFASYNFIRFNEVDNHDSEYIGIPIETTFGISTTTQMDAQLVKLGINYHFQ